MAYIPFLGNSTATTFLYTLSPSPEYTTPIICLDVEYTVFIIGILSKTSDAFFINLEKNTNFVIYPSTVIDKNIINAATI